MLPKPARLFRWDGRKRLQPQPLQAHFNIESAERMQLNRKFALVADQRETHAAVRRLNVLSFKHVSCAECLPESGRLTLQSSHPDLGAVF